MNIAILTPAYGRDYKNMKSVIADFDADKDFILNNITDPDCGRYCNKSNLLKSIYTHANIRYDKNRKVAVVEIK